METLSIVISAISLVLLAVTLFLLSKLNKDFSAHREKQSFESEEMRDIIKKLKEDQNKAYTEMMSELKGYTERVKTEEKEVFDEEVYELAEKEVVESGKASTSYLQRKLGIGYARAAHLIDMLEENGIIGPAKGTNPRLVIPEEEREES